MENLFVVTIIFFFAISFAICFFVKTRSDSEEYTKKNNSAKRIMTYVHNKNSSDGIQEYIKSFNKISDFKPNYIGWK